MGGKNETEDDIIELISKELKRELLNKDSKFYFAVVEDQIAGYLKVNFREAQTELQDPLAMEVERIYVLQSFQGKKVGQALMEEWSGSIRC